MTDTGWPIAIARARLFLVSYAALSFMFAARFCAADRWAVGISFALVGAWGVVDGFRLVKGTERRSKRNGLIDKIEDQGAAVASYLATYLLPFLGNLPSNWGDWTAYVIYFFIALLVYVKSDLAVVNPTLYALGYRVVRANIDGQKSLVVTKYSVNEGSRIRISEAMHVVIIHQVCEDQTL